MALVVVIVILMVTIRLIMLRMVSNGTDVEDGEVDDDDVIMMRGPGLKQRVKE